MINHTQHGAALQPYEKLIDYVKNNLQKGSIISHANIEQIIGISYRRSCNCLSSTYKYNIQRANEKLTVFSLRLEPIQGYGYRVIKDNEYMHSMEKAYKTGVKYIKKAKFIGNYVNTTNLSPIELKYLNEVSNKIDSVNHYLSSF